MNQRKLHELLPQAAAALGMHEVTDSWFSESKAVLIWLIDGMGYQNLQNSTSKHPALTQILKTPTAWSANPSTTPVSLTSLGTGLQAGQHGVIGATFEVPEFATLLKPLHWQDSPDPIGVQPEPTWFERLANLGVPVTRIGPVAYQDSGLSRAALRGGQHVPAESLTEMVETSLAAASVGGLVYAYHPTLDKRGHVYGTKSEEFQTELDLVLAAIGQVMSKLPSSVEFIVTADHGMLDVLNRIWIEDRPSLLRNVRLLAGEPRLRHVYAEPGCADLLLRDWQAIEDVADVYSREQFVATGWLGEVAEFAADRIGDVVAIARGGAAIGSRTFDRRASGLKGMHGSNSEQECQIPISRMAG